LATVLFPIAQGLILRFPHLMLFAGTKTRLVGFRVLPQLVLSGPDDRQRLAIRVTGLIEFPQTRAHFRPVDGRPHLEWARPVIAAGKPLFIDKPLAGSLADCIEIFRLAKEANVPCFSSSSLRFGSDLPPVRNGESEFGPIKSCVAWGPMSIEPHHPDLFWYGIHGCEILFTIMGTGCKTVTREGPEKVVGVWADGRTGTFEARKGYGADVVGTKGSGTVGKYEGYKPMVIEICKFFKTGKPPVSMQETLEIYTFMEAADESKRQGGKPVSMEDVFQKAQAANAARK
jgi:hypothetical protein